MRTSRAFPWAVGLVVCLVAATVSGCTTFRGQHEAGPLVSWTDQPDRQELVIRPLYGHRTIAPDRSYLHILWPLFQYRTRGKSWDVTALPVFYYIAHMDHYGFLDRDLMIGLFLWWGDSVDEGSYLTVLPFGGTLKGLLAKDKISWVLPPVYIRLDDKGTVSKHVMFPFVNWIHGGGHEGWRFWPFYGHYTKQNRDGTPRSDWTFILWPFYTRQRNLLDTATPAVTNIYFPFYGSIESEDYSETTYLWPFFKVRKLKKTGTTEYRAPFPFVYYTTGPDEQRFDLWPIYGVRKRGDYRRHFFLTPLERYEVKDSATERWYRFWLLPFWWDYYRIDKETGESQRTFSLWPLLRYQRNRDGETYLYLIAPEWFRDPEGYEKYWAHLWRPYRYYRSADGIAESNLLWGVYESKADVNDASSMRRILGGLVEYRNSGGTSDWSFFWGLF